MSCSSCSGVIVLVVTVLGLLAKVSLRRGVQSVDAELALQQRWGAVSLQRVLLDGAPKLFDDRDKKLIELGITGPPPPPIIRSAISIGDVTFDVMIADEDAKLNLNSLYHHGWSRKTEPGACGHCAGERTHRSATCSRDQADVAITSTGRQPCPDDVEATRARATMNVNRKSHLRFAVGGRCSIWPKCRRRWAARRHFRTLQPI